jgi:SAM-dependent methyltransferase
MDLIKQVILESEEIFKDSHKECVALQSEHNKKSSILSKHSISMYCYVRGFMEATLATLGQPGILNFLKEKNQPISLIDYGCGNGQMLYTLALFLLENNIPINRCVGYELYKPYIDLVPGKTSDILDIIQGDILDYTKEVNKFDLVYSYIPFVSRNQGPVQPLDVTPHKFQTDIMKHAASKTIFIMPGFPVREEMITTHVNKKKEGKFLHLISYIRGTDTFMKL